jgi:YVTN family beta-propeller protein
LSAFDSANGNLYVTNEGNNTLSVISGQTNSVIGNPIPVGSFPLGIAFDSANYNLYVTNYNSGTVSVISGQTNTVIGNPIAVGSGPYGIAFDSGNDNLYVANNGGTVSVISTTLTPTQSIQQLIQLIKSLGLDNGLQTSLIAHLNAALQFISHKHDIGACIHLDGFTKEVQGAVLAHRLSTADALELMQSAQAIQKALGCKQ